MKNMKKHIRNAVVAVLVIILGYFGYTAVKSDDVPVDPVPVEEVVEVTES